MLPKRHGCEVSGVFESPGRGRYLGLSVQGMTEVGPEEFVTIVITLVDDHEAEPILAALTERGISRDQIVTISPLGAGSGRLTVLTQYSGNPPSDTPPPLRRRGRAVHLFRPVAGCGTLP